LGQRNYARAARGLVTYRPRKLKQAKTPLSTAALRYFMADRHDG
jgi:hypothetical protein